MSIEDAIRHHEAGRLREAERLYRSMLDDQPHHPDALHLLGVLLTQLGEYQGAAEHIQAALDVERDSALFRSSLAQTYFRSGKLAEAIEQLERVVAMQPGSFQAFSDPSQGDPVCHVRGTTWISCAGKRSPPVALSISVVRRS